MNNGPVKRYHNQKLDIRDMLLSAGVGQYNVMLAIPYMYMLPATTEPYAQGVQLIIKGLQRLLNRHGAKFFVAGGMGSRTIKAVILFSGPRWEDKSWAQLYGDVISGERWQGFIRNDRVSDNLYADRALEGDMIGGLVTNPLVLVAAGVAVWWKFFRKPSRSSLEGL